MFTSKSAHFGAFWHRLSVFFWGGEGGEKILRSIYWVWRQSPPRLLPPRSTPLIMLMNFSYFTATYRENTEKAGRFKV